MRRRRSLKPLTVGAIAAVVLVIVTFFGFTKTNPFANPYQVRAAFVGPGDVRPGSKVRIAGVDVGKVTGFERNEEDPRQTVLEMEISDEGLPLKEDARMRIRPRLFLEGNYFIDIEPGTPSAEELDEGSMVPATQTSTYVSYGDVLKVFETDTRDDLRTVLDEYGKALGNGGAEAFNRATRYWEPAFRNSAQVNDAFQGLREGDLAGYVRNQGRAASGLSRNTPQLRDLVTNLAETGQAFAREQFALSATIAELPRTLRQGYRTLGVVDDALPNVRTLARELTPAVRTSPATLDAAVPLARQLRGLIRPAELGGLARDLGTAVPPLARVTRRGIKLQGEARLLASCGNEVLLETSEKTIDDDRFPANGPIYEEFIKWLPGGAGGGRNFDANGLYSRTLAPSGVFVYPVLDKFLYNTQPILGVNPAPAELPPLRPQVACETQEPPDLASVPGGPPPGEIEANFEPTTAP